MPTRPDTPLARLSREQLPEHMRDAWDQALQLHGDTTFVEVFGHAPHVCDWYLEEYHRKLSNTRGHITPDLYTRLRAYYSDGEIVELGVIFDLVEKMGSCPYLPPGGR